MEIGWLFFGIGIGFCIGIQYIPHQIKKNNKKVISSIKEQLSKIDE